MRKKDRLSETEKANIELNKQFEDKEKDELDTTSLVSIHHSQVLGAINKNDKEKEHGQNG